MSEEIIFQEYKITIKDRKDAKSLKITGKNPLGLGINYQCNFRSILSVCVQTHTDKTGILHLAMEYNSCRHDFQFLIRDTVDNKQEILKLCNVFKPFLG